MVRRFWLLTMILNSISNSDSHCFNHFIHKISLFLMTTFQMSHSAYFHSHAQIHRHFSCCFFVFPLFLCFSTARCVGTVALLIPQRHKKSTGKVEKLAPHFVLVGCIYVESVSHFSCAFFRQLIFWVNRRVPVWAIQVRGNPQWECTLIIFHSEIWSVKQTSTQTH